MKCPICVERGLRSEVDVLGPFTRTLMGGQRMFYDEDGNKHWHDPNDRVGDSYRCSYNHTFAPAFKPCPSCDYHAQPAWQKDACECGHLAHTGRCLHTDAVPDKKGGQWTSYRHRQCECDNGPQARLPEKSDD